MKKKRILYVSSEVVPYLPENDQSYMSLEMPKKMHENGSEVRIFTPRFGVINERRHQLHEVIRLSGMNLIINDMDQPLIIKVASIPKERLQVYFIDNEEYFKRKSVYTDVEGNMHPDNDEKAIFFAKGVLETVKKLNWGPDVIHVNGWMAGLLPLYLKTVYKDDPAYADTKIVTSVYNNGFEGTLDPTLAQKLKFDQIADEDLAHLEEPSYAGIIKNSVAHSDAVIVGSENLGDDLDSYLENCKLPVLEYQDKENFVEAYNNFYKELVV